MLGEGRAIRNILTLSTQKDLFVLFEGITFHLFGFKPIPNIIVNFSVICQTNKGWGAKTKASFFFHWKKDEMMRKMFLPFNVWSINHAFHWKKRIKKILASLYPSHPPRTLLALPSHNSLTPRIARCCTWKFWVCPSLVPFFLKRGARFYFVREV